MIRSKGEFEHSLLEILVEQHRFEIPNEWACLRGGAQQIAVGMEGRLNTKPEYDRRVTEIVACDESVIVSVRAPDEESSQRKYDVLFNATTLLALQRINLDLEFCLILNSLGNRAYNRTGPFEQVGGLVELGVSIAVLCFTSTVFTSTS